MNFDFLHNVLQNVSHDNDVLKGGNWVAIQCMAKQYNYNKK